MLIFSPKSWISWDYEILDGEAVVATLHPAWFGERGTLAIGGRTLELGRRGWMSGAFFLQEAGETRALADKPSAFFRSFEVTFDQSTYTWRAESSFTRAFALLQNDRVIGSMRADSAFTRRSTMDLPENVSLERRAFLAWLALVTRRRQRQG